MTTQNEDWQELSKVWTKAGSEADSEGEIDAALIAVVRRRALLSRLNFAGEVLISLMATAFLVWAVVVREVTGQPIIVAVAFIVFAIAISLWLRWQEPNLLADTQAQALRTALAQARSGLRWAWAGLAVCGASAVYLALLMLQMMRIWEYAVVTVVAFGAFILVWVFICIRHARTSRRRIETYSEAIIALEKDGSQE